MYTIEFYEDRNGKCDLGDFLHMLHAAHREEFCKAAAFLDYLAENGARGDKVVCRYPEGMIYMHCIPGIEKHPEGSPQEQGTTAPAPFLYGKDPGPVKKAPSASRLFVSSYTASPVKRQTMEIHL